MGSLDIGSLNAVDILILVIFFISIIIGLGRGLVSEVLSLIILIAAFVIAIMFTSPLATYFASTATVHSVVSQTTTATGTDTSQPLSYMAIGVSFAILFASTVIAGGIIKMLLNLIFLSGILGFGNRILGGIFGFVRGGLFNLALIFLVQLSPAANQTWWQQSHLVPYFHPYVEELGKVVSPTLENIKSTFSSGAEDIGNQIKSTPISTQPMSAAPPTTK